MNRLATLVAFAFLAVSTSSFYQPVSAHPSIDITAANWKFTPEAITLHVGEASQLRLTSTEGVHGIKSDDLGLAQTMLTPGKFVTVTVTPKKPGTYVLHCAVLCGPGHEKMTLTVVVESK